MPEPLDLDAIEKKAKLPLTHQLIAEIRELRKDKKRLEFIFSTLDEMGLHDAWIEKWIPDGPFSSAKGRADEDEWRLYVDAAIQYDA